MESPDEKYFCVATLLPIQRGRDIFPFLRLTIRITRQLREDSGCLRHRVKAAFFQKRFWTLSVWTSKGAAQAFVRSGAHALAVQKFRDWAAPGAAFVEWYSPTQRVTWRTAFERLKTPTFTYDL